MLPPGTSVFASVNGGVHKAYLIISVKIKYENTYKVLRVYLVPFRCGISMHSNFILTSLMEGEEQSKGGAPGGLNRSAFDLGVVSWSQMLGVEIT